MNWLNDVLRAKDGPLSRETRLMPAGTGYPLLPQHLTPDLAVESVCGFCSTGCNLQVHLRNGEPINVVPARDYPVNDGAACPKGWESLAVLQSDDRATRPLLRQSGKPKPVSWDAALRVFCERMKAIQSRYGRSAIAFLSTGQLPTEELALLGCLTKFGMGTLHGDGNTRQCMASAVVAYKEAFGFDAPPYTYADFEESDVIVLVGSNLCIAHPIMWQRISRNPHRPEIIVIDPRRTETAMAATQHVALRPKSDLALFYGIAQILIERGWIDRQFLASHTRGFEEFRDHVAEFTPTRVAETTGISTDELERLASTIQRGSRVSFWWTMGVNQSYEGVRTAQSIINLALLTGNLGRPGTGANSITGQCNAMGSRLFSNTTNLLGGHDFSSGPQREKIASLLGIQTEHIPDRSGWPYHKIMEGIVRGDIRGLWVIGTNPAHSWINQSMCHDILSRLDFLVVQDMYCSTDTAQRADLLLPAGAWGEKDGTFINSERRIGVIRKVQRPPGEALSDFTIFRAIARYWGCGKMFNAWTDPEAAFQILKSVSRGQPCDFSGIADYEMIQRQGGIQWPYPEFDPPQAAQRRLFEDGRFYHTDGRARFVFESPRVMPELPNDQYPFLLLTGRGSVAQWHTQTRTSKSEVLRQLYPQRVYVEMNPQDARANRITPGQEVIVQSQRGRLKAHVHLTPTIASGQVFIPMHYAVTNRLTHPHFDPYSHQPSYKDCAVLVRPATKHDR